MALIEEKLVKVITRDRENTAGVILAQIGIVAKLCPGSIGYIAKGIGFDNLTVVTHMHHHRWSEN
jgi:hypothetical protein